MEAKGKLKTSRQRCGKWLVVLFALSAISIAPAASGQAVSVAGVSGYVTDPSGHPVANAQVTMIEIGKNQVHTTQSDSETGRYTFPTLPVGTYDLGASAPTFRTYKQRGIVLQVGSNISVNVQLPVGNTSETIEVTASTGLIETKDNSIAEVIDQRRVVDLPLNGRNPTQLITLTGAATAVATVDLVTSKNIGGSNGSGTFSVAGSQANGINYVLDGGDNNDALFNVNLPLPFPDALQEFSVQTSALPAQYGLHPGGVVNAVTKSGSNAFHGDVFEFLRNGAFNGTQRNTPSRDSLKRSQFGGVLGGAILRDKLFFFAGYQGTRQRSNPPQRISFVATAAALAGDFTTLTLPKAQGGCLSQATPRTLIDPQTSKPFPGNQIPVSRFSAPAVSLLTKYLPASSDKCGAVKYGLTANSTDDQEIGRIDYIHSSKTSLYGRYYIYDFAIPTVFDGSNLLTTQAPGQLGRSQTATFGHTYSISPTVLNSFHATFNRRRDDRGSAPNDINPKTLGINITAPIDNFILLNVSNYFSVGCGTCSPGHFNANTYQASDDMIMSRGRHEIAFGGEFRRFQANLLTNNFTNAVLDFNGSTTGDGLADLLIGRLSQISQANSQPDALRQRVFSLYAQDTFHVSKQLVLNIGMRWEPSSFPYDRYGRTPYFSQPDFNAGIVSATYPTAPPGIRYPDDPGNTYGKNQVRTYWRDVSPRVGFIFNPRASRTESIRAGFALMHDTGLLYYPQRWTVSPPFASQVIISKPAGDLSNPYLGQAGGNPFPNKGFFPIGGVYYMVPHEMPSTYMMQWNLTIQHQIGKNWLFQEGYLGTKSVHVWSQYDLNPSIYIPGSTATTNQRRILYLQKPSAGQYYSSIFSGDPGGNSKYNGLLVSLQHPFANHFTILTNYTYSQCISDSDLGDAIAGSSRANPFSRSAERGSCNADRRHIYNLSLVATSPELGTTLVKALTRNWQFSPIFTAASGGPLNITDGGLDISGNAQLNDRPNQVLTSAYPAARGTSAWFNPAAFAKQPVGQIGNVGRNSLRAPGNYNFDAAVSRTFQIHDQIGFMFRVEAFNALNHANWNAPATSITSGQFGQITSFGPPRILQLASKIVF